MVGTTVVVLDLLIRIVFGVAVGVGFGVGAIKVNNVFAAFVPFGDVTNTLEVPAVPAGVVAVILVELTTVTLVAAVPPMVTLVAPVKLVPVMVIAVLPDVDPLVGKMLVTVGALAGGGVGV